MKNLEESVVGDFADIIAPEPKIIVPTEKWGVRFGDLIKQPIIEPKWLVKDWFPAGTSKILVADSGAGKTTWIANMVADHFCDGQVMGQKTEQFPVIYLNYEVGTWFFVDRIRQAVGKRLPDDLNKHLICFNLDAETPKARPKNPLDGDWLFEVLQDYWEEYQNNKGIICVDTFRSSNRGNNDLKAGWENSDMAGQLIDKLHFFAHQTGWSVLIVHHKNKTGGTSGHNSITSMVDTVDNFWRVENTNLINIQTTKRVLKEETRAFRFDKESNRYQFVGTVDEVVNQAKLENAQQIKDRIVQLVAEGEKSAGELEKTIPVAHQIVRNCITTLVNNGTIRKTSYHGGYVIVN